MYDKAFDFSRELIYCSILISKNWKEAIKILKGRILSLRSQSVASGLPLAIGLIGTGNRRKQPYCTNRRTGKTQQTEKREAP